MESVTKEYYSAEEVAEILGVHSRTVLNYIKAGKIPGKRLGSKWLISVEGLRRVLADE